MPGRTTRRPGTVGSRMGKPAEDRAENQGPGGDQQGAPSSASASASASPEQGGLTAQAAEETLQRVYTAAASEEYGTSYGLLSQNFKASEGVTEAEWANTFADLQSIRFVEGPDAQVSGNTATVDGGYHSRERGPDRAQHSHLAYGERRRRVEARRHPVFSARTCLRIIG